MKHVESIIGSCLLAIGLNVAAQGSQPFLTIAGQGGTGPGGWNLTLDARLGSDGASGHSALLGGAAGPVVQVVPPSDDPCGCWCINIKRTDVGPRDGDQRQNIYIRDIGDGITSFDQMSFITSIGGDCSSFATSGLFFLTLGSGNFQATVRDGDRDGVVDYLDECPGTAVGAVVNEHGCSIEQLVPCAGPVTGGMWKNHGHYVLAMLRATAEFESAGLISKQERRAIMRAAARSDCGKKPHHPKRIK